MSTESTASEEARTTRVSGRSASPGPTASDLSHRYTRESSPAPETSSRARSGARLDARFDEEAQHLGTEVNRSRLSSWASGTRSWLKENGEWAFKLAKTVVPNVMQSLGKFNSASENGRRFFAAGVAANGLEGAVVAAQELRKYVSGEEYSLARGAGGAVLLTGSVVRAFGAPGLGAPDLPPGTQDLLVGAGAVLQAAGAGTLHAYDPANLRSQAARLSSPGRAASVDRPSAPTPDRAAGRHATHRVPSGAYPGPAARRRHSL